MNGHPPGASGPDLPDTTLEGHDEPKRSTIPPTEQSSKLPAKPCGDQELEDDPISAPRPALASLDIPNTVNNHRAEPGSEENKPLLGHPGKADELSARDQSVLQTTSPKGQDGVKQRVLKLSSAELEELTSSPESSTLRLTEPLFNPLSTPPSVTDQHASRAVDQPNQAGGVPLASLQSANETPSKSSLSSPPDSAPLPSSSRPTASLRHSSSQSLRKRSPSSRINGTSRSSSKPLRAVPAPIHLTKSNHLSIHGSASKIPGTPEPVASPMPSSIPLPPMSFPTYLQLELSSSRPSPLYIHRPATRDFPYESSQVKFERLLNFLLLPPQLEGVLWFGALACLDAWLYSFTILPLRFLKAAALLTKWWGLTLIQEAADILSFIYLGAGRMWRRRQVTAESPSQSSPDTPSRSIPEFRIEDESNIGKKASQIELSTPATPSPAPPSPALDRRPRLRRHRRRPSTPSSLMPSDKADLLKGLVVLFSCLVLLRFDASRMYHGIRGQAAIKLYVIYNVLEVCDRLFSALGQDVFECLFSRETLERGADGRSKILRPFGMFLLALSYNVIHSTALFYQVITLNVAVNSYSNALLTLLMSNQFVEIKSTVFKKFEKENLFQLTCADVVERFQLWLMLLIIAMRNLVEVGGLSLGQSSNGFADGFNDTTSSGASIIPKSFTLFPEWSGQVLGPFMLVLGSEMLVDWLKHAYVTKFNNTKPAIYGRFLDVLAKDYYSDAFSDQNLTRRLGLPVIPLSCLFIRASLQTYHMFLATTVPVPAAASTTSLTDESASSTPVATAALAHFDTIVRRALGRSAFGAGASPSGLSFEFTLDDLIAFLTMLLFFALAFFLLLAFKLLLGMTLLTFARRRYKGMKEREHRMRERGGDDISTLAAEKAARSTTDESIMTTGRRIGGWGVVEVDDDKRRWIYADDPEGARLAREREKAIRERGGVVGGVSTGGRRSSFSGGGRGEDGNAAFSGGESAALCGGQCGGGTSGHDGGVEENSPQDLAATQAPPRKMATSAATRTTMKKMEELAGRGPVAGAASTGAPAASSYDAFAPVKRYAMVSKRIW